MVQGVAVGFRAVKIKEQRMYKPNRYLNNSR